MNRSLLATLCAVALISGCNCPGPNVTDGGTGGGSGGGTGTGGGATGGGATGGGSTGGGTGGGSMVVDAGEFDGGCFVLGELCSSDTDCCSLFCGANGRCSTQTFCNAAGTACTSSTQCCSNLCVNGSCSANQCLSEGAACTGGTECCTRNCAVPAPIIIPDGGVDGGPITVDAGSTPVCTPVQGNNGMCQPLGSACTTTDAGTNDCCSTLCRGGYCSPAYVCQANYDVCGSNNECCGNACSVQDGGAGFCDVITGGGSGACLQDGNPCSGAGGCCTRTCVDLGSGATVCGPATGCRLAGDFCSATSQCCGGAPNPNGTVMCDPSTKRCTNGTMCSPPGVICGNALLLDGGVLSINANVDCCTGGQPPVDTSNLCKLDSSGVPRCFGGKTTMCPTGYTGQAGCCIAGGSECQFKDQCCGGAPCLPKTDGGAGFVCSGANSCAAVGDTCGVAGADGGGAATCCAGSVCQSNVCQLPRVDAGTPDAGFDAGTPCLANGVACASNGECCGMICTSRDGGPNLCQPPAVCSMQGAACTAASDCCAGLGCTVPAGSTTGTCQPSTCAGLGQTCSQSTACCSSLFCLDSAGNNCGATGACTCRTPIL